MIHRVAGLGRRFRTRGAALGRSVTTRRSPASPAGRGVRVTINPDADSNSDSEGAAYVVALDPGALGQNPFVPSASLVAIGSDAMPRRAVAVGRLITLHDDLDDDLNAHPGSDGADAGAGSLADNDASEFATVLRDVLTAVPATVRDTFVRTATGTDLGQPDDVPDPALWGDAPALQAVRTAALDNLQRQFTARRAALAAALTRAEAAELLGVSEQTVLNRIDGRSLVALKDGREWRLPAWQFNSDTTQGFVPELAALQRDFPGGAVSLTEWVQAPNVDLGGTTPLAALVAGRADDVVRAASQTTSAAW